MSCPPLVHVILQTVALSAHRRWPWHACAHVQVSQNMLTPSLHVAVCGLLDPELARGPMAREREFLMERYATC
jgi:hypothetical protein